jgi:hypothetical protein
MRADAISDDRIDRENLSNISPDRLQKEKSSLSINLQVIDADGHVLEPPDLWLNYIEPKFREFAPRLVTNAEGAEILFIGDREMTDNGPNRRRVKVGATGAIGAREGTRKDAAAASILMPESWTWMRRVLTLPSFIPASGFSSVRLRIRN